MSGIPNSQAWSGTAICVGKRVEVHYRSGDFYLSCVGTLASDDGESIIVHEQFSSGGSQKTMRVEIPYSYIVRACGNLPGTSSCDPVVAARSRETALIALSASWRFLADP